MSVPETRYARSADVAIAYQVVGEGPFDVVLTPGSVSHVELYWDIEGVAALLRVWPIMHASSFSTSGARVSLTGWQGCQRWRSAVMTYGR
jgi:hypothetical protein